MLVEPLGGTSRKVRGLAWIAALAIATVPAQAQTTNYPNRTIALIVPFAAGGPTDVVARTIAERLSQEIGQPIVIENVVGAGGTTGALRGARAAPDGYTLVMGQMGTHALSVALYPKLAYDPVKDFLPVGMVASAPQILVARKDVAASSLKSFREFVRSKSGAISNAHAGVGSTSHVACLLFNADANVVPSYIAYRGTAPALNDLIAGHVDYMCDQVTNTVSQIRSGTVKAISLFAPSRSAVLPDVPTAAEEGSPGLNAVIWNALFLPAATPEEIVRKLNQALIKSLDHPQVAARFEQLGAVLPSSGERSPAYLGDLVKSEIARWSPIIRAAGVAAQN